MVLEPMGERRLDENPHPPIPPHPHPVLPMNASLCTIRVTLTSDQALWRCVKCTKGESLPEGRGQAFPGLLLLESGVPGHGTFQKGFSLGASSLLDGGNWVSAAASGCSAFPHLGIPAVSLQASDGQLAPLPSHTATSPLVLMERQHPLAACWF